jgi:hypothetical protein
VLADDTSEEEREQFQVLCIAIGLALSAILHGPSDDDIEARCLAVADKIVDWMEK